jgi:tetratricopeptide (TPR) repeat protein
VSYWKRSALINHQLEHYTEADIAFQNAIELGNYEPEMWTRWMETLLFLNEWEKGIRVGQQAKEFYSDNIDLDAQIAVCFYRLAKPIEMDYFLQNIRKSPQGVNEKILTAFPFLSKLLSS